MEEVLLSATAANSDKAEATAATVTAEELDPLLAG